MTPTRRDVWRFEAIGTHWRVETPQPLPPAAREAIAADIAAFDLAWSRFRPDSTVTRLSSAGGGVPLPVDADVMLDAFAALADATHGGVNPLVGRSLEVLGYDADVTLRAIGRVPAPADWRRALTWDDGMLRLDRPAVIDVGALGKGRLVDRVLALIVSLAGAHAVVDAGGDIALRGRGERIALEHPYDPTRAIGVVEVADAALCASAVNRRAWGDGLHHVLDARTGTPVRTITATWAIADDAMTADAAATALFFEGGPRFAHERGVEWVRMTTDGQVEWSPGSTAELFT
ncbi:FAD:protein FMN transferase [Microbacterium awajiense]|uniref:FAD:protein FMN transferase n=1 Tax=Microbacterium awajiense TaxID=415214 RepID=A0ABP7ABV3_9MICO